MALNSIAIMGRLTADPQLRRTGTGTAVASFTIAVEDDYKDDQGNKKTIFVDCVAWRGLGETVAKYFSKGRMAIVKGKLDIRSWTDKEGNKRRTAEVIADNVYFADSKRDDQGGSTYGSAPAGSYGGGYAAPTGPSDFAMMDDPDSQLPF